MSTMYYPGAVVNSVVADIKYEKNLRAITLYQIAMHPKPKARKVKTVHCPVCGATLQVDKSPRWLRCTDCRTFHAPCAVDDIKCVCDATGCRFDRRDYEEATAIRVRGGVVIGGL